MKKILLNALNVLLICSIVSCSGWEWEARPYCGDSESQSIYNATGESVSCSDPVFDSFTCFDAENIEELAVEIEKAKGKLSKGSYEKMFSILEKIRQ